MYTTALLLCNAENVLLDADGHVRLAGECVSCVAARIACTEHSLFSACAIDFGLSKEGITASTEGTKSFCGTPE